jgi:transposase-like protein
MNHGTVESLKLPLVSAADALTEILRQGARTLLAQAVETEVAAYVAQHAQERDEAGHRLVVRNGYLPERQVQTGIGLVPIRQPRVNDKRRAEDGQRLHFTSQILPPYLRRTRSVEQLIPWLYLKGKYPKAAECLAKDRPTLLTFYDFPAEHWVHLRTTNPIESTFATVRLRTEKTKGCGSRQACLSMVFKLCQSAGRHWWQLNGKELLGDIIAGVIFVDGIKAAA